METSPLRPASLEVGDILSQSWRLACRHFPVFIATAILAYVVSQFSSFFMNMEAFQAFVMENLQYGRELEPEEVIEVLFSGTSMATFAVAQLVAWLLALYIEVANYKMYLGAVDYDKPDLGGALKTAYKPYLMFLAASFVYGAIVTVGMLFCVLPGIYLAVRLLFVPYLAVDKPELSFDELFTRSWKMTDGHFMELLLLGIVSVGVSLAGVFICCIGVYFTAIISGFMLVLTYRALAPKDGMPTDEAPLGAPAAPASGASAGAETPRRDEGGYSRSEK